MGLDNRDYSRDTPWEREERRRYGGGGGYARGGGWSGFSMSAKIIIVTCATWLLSILVGDLTTGDVGGSWVFDVFAMRGETLIKPWLWFQWVTYGFLHSPTNPWHLFGNMLGLFFFGRWVEQARGPMELLRLYLTSMVVSGIVGSAFHFFRDIPFDTIGASGAVACITIVFVLNNLHETILLFLVIPVPAWLLGLGFTLYNLYGARMSLYGVEGGQTAFMVHLGGIAFALAYERLRLNLSFLDFNRLREIPRQFRDRARRAKLKVHDPDRIAAKHERDADAVLDKIHREGEESLTAAERRILQRYSRDQRRRRT